MTDSETIEYLLKRVYELSEALEDLMAETSKDIQFLYARHADHEVGLYKLKNRIDDLEMRDE